MVKNWLLAALFIVSWNEYELKTRYDGVAYNSVEDGGASLVYHPQGHPLPSTIEIITHTIRLATQKDFDLFIGKCPQIKKLPSGKLEYKYCENGLIGDKAFNITAKEEKE